MKQPDQVKLCAWAGLLLAATPLAAQDALDRTNPAGQAPEEDASLAPPNEPRIEVRPVLDMAPGEAGGATLDVGAILIEGLEALPAAAFADVIAPFAGRPLTHAELARLTDAIAERARAQGYALATAWIPEQRLVAGTLRVRIDEGRIDALRIKGDDDPALRRQLEALVGRGPVTLAQIERTVLLADDLPGVWIGATRFEREGASRVLVVEARRSDAGGSLQLASDGTKPLGPVRARIDLDANGLISPRDRVDLSLSLTPLEPEEQAFFSARYAVIVSDAGTSLGAFGSYSRTEPGAYLAARELLGESWQGGLRLRHPLLRRQRRGLWLEASGEVNDLRQDALGALVRHDRITLGRIGLYGFGPFAGGTLQGRATLSQGLPLLGATDTGDPRSSRLAAAPDFTTFGWWLQWRRPLAPRLSLALGTIGQIASGPLLIGERFTLGGGSFLRGYDFAQGLGDEGIAGSAELRYDWPKPHGGVRSLQLYAFADGGMVSNRDGPAGEESLASGGAGLRADITRRLDLDVEVALPLSEPRYDTLDRSPRLNLRVSRNF